MSSFYLHELPSIYVAHVVKKRFLEILSLFLLGYPPSPVCAYLRDVYVEHIPRV